MDSRQDVVDAYNAAMEAERLLWEQVRGRGPGHPDFKRADWDLWLEAVARTNATSKALREVFSIPVVTDKH